MSEYRPCPCPACVDARNKMEAMATLARPTTPAPPPAPDAVPIKSAPQLIAGMQSKLRNAAVMIHAVSADDEDAALLARAADALGPFVYWDCETCKQRNSWWATSCGRCGNTRDLPKQRNSDCSDMLDLTPVGPGRTINDAQPAAQPDPAPDDLVRQMIHEKAQGSTDAPFGRVVAADIVALRERVAELDKRGSLTNQELRRVANEFQSERDAAKRDSARAFDERDLALNRAERAEADNAKLRRVVEAAKAMRNNVLHRKACRVCAANNSAFDAALAALEAKSPLYSPCGEDCINRKQCLTNEVCLLGRQFTKD